MYRSLKHLPRDYLAEVCDEAFGERESVMAEGEREIEEREEGWDRTKRTKRHAESF